jgi:hypothetical protein
VFGRPSRLDAGQKRKIAERYAAGETMAALAADYEVGEATIFRAPFRTGRVKRRPRGEMMTDEDIEAMIRDLIGRHVADPERGVVLDWLAKRAAFYDAGLSQGLVPPDDLSPGGTTH